MMLVPHACVNAAAGRLFSKRVAAFAAGVVAHAIFDLVPHKDVSANKAEGLLVLVMLGLVGSSCGLKSPASRNSSALRIALSKVSLSIFKYPLGLKSALPSSEMLI